MFKQLTLEQLTAAYQNACMNELQALKPGNVHVFSDGHGMTIHDFIKSADASVIEICKPNRTVGERILSAVTTTQQAIGLNTNLGLILLCAPLIHAASFNQIKPTETLKKKLIYTLNQLSVHDAQLTSQAIVLANPAGLGNTDKYDVHHDIGVTLLEMMCSAQSKDRIAFQYAHAFTDILDFGLPQYKLALDRWQNQAWATTALYLGFLARYLDTHIVRKYGEMNAEIVMIEAKNFETDYWATDNPKLMQKKLLDWDASLKNRNINPGTSADLTVATLLAVQLA